MSKGSKQRPTDKLQFDENYDNINWNKMDKEKEPRLTKEQMKMLLKDVKTAPELSRSP